MRNLVYAINLTIDGCCDHTKMIGNEEIHEYFTQLIRDAGVLVYGRITYQLMVPYWPDVAESQSMAKATNEFARTFDAVEKVVFSRTLEKVDDKNSRLVRTKLEDEIVKMKKEPGKNILLGGVDLSSQLIALGLVDEYYFVVNPVIGGDGRRLLEGVSLPAKLQLRLVDSKVFRSGCVALHYVKQ